MNHWKHTGQAVGQLCSARWRKFRAELVDLSERLREAVVGIIARAVSEASAEALHCVLQPAANIIHRVYQRPVDPECWDDDDDWTPPSRSSPARQPDGIKSLVFKTAAWWLLRQGAMLPAMAIGLVAGSVAWLGGGEVVHGLRQVVELLLIFRERFRI